MLLSIVDPLLKEEANITPFLARVEAAAEGLAAPLDEECEIVCVDDDSRDQRAAKPLAEHYATRTSHDRNTKDREWSVGFMPAWPS